MNYSLWRSKTFWTIVLMAIVGGGNAIVPVLPPTYSASVITVLAILASVFHLSTGQSTTGTN